MRTFNLAGRLRHMALLPLICSAALRAEGEATIKPPGGKPPAAVLRVAAREAAWRRRGVDEAGDPDTKSFPPKRLVTQKIVDFRHLGRSAWLLLYSVAEVGPRAHAPVSQLVMVSSKDPHVIFEVPSRRHPSQDEDAPEAPEDHAGEADNALMVEINPGRFALALSYGGQSKIPGEVSLLALSRNHPPKTLWICNQNGARVESRIYFVKLASEKATALAVRQVQQVWEPKQNGEGGDSKLVEHQFIYHLDPKTDEYTPLEMPPERLAKIIRNARRNRESLRIEQWGTTGVYLDPDE